MDNEYLSNISSQEWIKVQKKYYKEFSSKSGYFSRKPRFLNLKSARRIFDSEKILFWVTDGTLLGFYRDGNFIKWDNEVDLDTLYDILKPNIYKLRIKFINKGFIVRCYDNGKKIKINLYRNGSKVSIRGLYDLKGYRRDKFFISGIYQYPKKFFQNFSKIEIDGYRYNAPNPIGKYILYVYGKNWDRPIRIKRKSKIAYGGWLSKKIRISTEQKKQINQLGNRNEK